jgi:hypothetical protein
MIHSAGPSYVRSFFFPAEDFRADFFDALRVDALAATVRSWSARYERPTTSMANPLHRR